MGQTQHSRQSRPTTADELREAFLKFYEDRGHLRMQAASLIPANDPTLLLTNSGMAQFKQYFSGELEPPRPRITTSQKSFRTTDIESVGDATHLTLFEMLGNFSFGDYFKKEACAWALELMTQALKFPAERLYFTVFENDDEAIEIWQKLGVPRERIYRFGAKDNFWGPAGAEGPCGPCSEIHYYSGDLKKVPGADDPVRKTSWGPNLHRDFVELYNLVFTQLYHHQDGRRTELPKKNIDTGMGLERVLVALQGVKNVYETDVFRPLIARAEQLSGKEWGQDPESSRALSVVAEHGRSAAFLIGDGVVPGNTGRGYVLRRLIRRAMLFGRQIGLKESFLPELAGVAGGVMGSAYPELVKNGPFIKRVLELEEERFARTLEFGSAVLDGMIEYRRLHGLTFAKLISEINEARLIPSSVEPMLGSRGFAIKQGDDPNSVGQRAAQEALIDLANSSNTARDVAPRRGTAEALQDAVMKNEALVHWPFEVSGREAFLLYDTYGFPIELTRELLQRALMAVDLKGFEAEMEAQRERGRAAGAKFGGDMAQRRVYEDLGVDVTPFLGYHATTVESVVIGVVRNGELVQSAREGEQVEVVLRETPFYAEKGGQVGDTGALRIQSPLSSREEKGGGEVQDAVVEVTDTQNPYAHVISHHGTVKSGQIKVGDAVSAEVDARRRGRIQRNHTATHLLHAALREVLGQHVRQAGSLVAPDRLRFDFTHMAPMTPAELRAAHDLVSEQIRANEEVHVEHTTYAEAIQKGALAFFGDKYENEVRAVCIAGAHPGQPHKQGCWSYELCGGTHMDRTGGIGAFVVVSETGIGAGMRRIEALTGAGADDFIAQRLTEQGQLAGVLRVSVSGTLERVESLIREREADRKRLAELEDQLLKVKLRSAGQQDARTADVQLDGVQAKLQVSRVSASSADALRRAGDMLRDRAGSGVVIVGGVIDGQPSVTVMVTKDLVAKGLHAGNIARGLATLMGGGGGGRPDVAQAGGKDAAKLDEALSAAERVVRESLQAGGKR
jgi:alanyl-tRNA synthetase